MPPKLLIAVPNYTERVSGLFLDAMIGLTATPTGVVGHGGGRGPSPAGRVLKGGLKMAQSNMGMHPTADTTALNLRQRCGAAGDAWR